MKLPRTRAEEDAHDSDDALDDAEPQPEAPRPGGGYRVAGDLEVRSKELEQELVQMKVRLRMMEREVYAASKVVRRRRQLRRLREVVSERRSRALSHSCSMDST